MIGMRRTYGIAESFGQCVPPGSRWIIRDDDYNKLEWMETIEPPTLEMVLEKQKQLTEEEPMRVLREIRDWYLQQSDWTQVQDLRKLRGKDWCNAWDTYRQQLRDLTENVTNVPFDENNYLRNVTWPTKPNFN